MNKKEIIILAAIGAGVYILSQVKAMKTYIAPQYAKTAAEKVAEKVAEEENEHIRERTPLTPAVPMPRRIAEKIPDAATPAARRRMAEKIAIRKRTAKKIAEKIGKRVAKGLDWKTFFSTSSIMKIRDPMARMKKILEAKRLGKIPLLGSTRKNVNISRLPVAQIRYMISHAAALRKTREEVAALKAEEALRVARSKAAQKVAVRKAAAQKIGKKIGKTVAQKIPLYIKIRRAVIAQYAKRQRPQIQRPNPNKKQPTSKLFPGAERSRIIPYSESSRHSYYGPKSHKLQNEGYGKNKAERDRKRALEFRLQELRDMFPSSNL